MKHFLLAIGHFFKAAGVFVDESLVKLFGEEKAHAFAGAAIALLETELGKIVAAAVKEAALLGNSGDQARSFAFSNIVAAAKAAGIEAKTSLINMLIELAVEQYKQVFGSSVSMTDPK